MLAAKRQFSPLQSRIWKFSQKWIEADQELEAAHAKQVQAKHEMSILGAEQTAENAKAVNQGTSGIQSFSSLSNPDPDAQQTILSVFKSVLSMQNIWCHSVAEQLMAAGATDEEVKKISQNMAQTVRKLKGGSTVPEPGIEVPKPACDVVVLDAELPSCIPGFSSMDIEGQEAIKRSLSNAATEKRRCSITCSVSGFGFGSSQHLSTSRFPELVQRRIQVLFALQRSCLAPNPTQLELEKLFAQVGECRHLFSERFGKDSKPHTSSVSQDIHSTHGHPDRSSMLALSVHVSDPAYTQQFRDHLSLFQEGEQSGSGQHVLSNLHFRGMEGQERSNPFVIARPEEDATHWEETQAGAFQRCGEYSPMQRDCLE